MVLDVITHLHLKFCSATLTQTVVFTCMGCHSGHGISLTEI